MPTAPLRVFAHGSLVFRPGPLPGPGVPATVTGWSRRFFHPSVRNWGRPAWPAPTSCLVPGGSVSGLLFEVPDPDGSVLAELVRREAADPVDVPVATPDGRVPAVTWTMSARWADRDIPALAAAAGDNVARGGGPFGDARDYVEGIARVLGPARDAHLEEYRRALATVLGTPRRPPDGAGR